MAIYRRALPLVVSQKQSTAVNQILLSSKQQHLISIVLVLVAGSAAVKPGTDFVEPLGLILFPVVFGIASNLCYTAGWIIDIVLFCSAPRLRLFRTGLIASTALASQPGLWAVIAWMITIYTGHKLE